MHQSAMDTNRLTSLDILRGATMVALCLQILNLPLGVTKFPDSAFWQLVSTQFSHAAWTGMTAWDLIQPLFMFMVGIALPWSVANRRANGAPIAQLWRHVIWRSLGLIAIGVMLRSLDTGRTQFVFTDVLSQIGLGYPILFALSMATQRVQILSGVGILGACYAAYLLYPAPDYAAHWAIHQNTGAAFDHWFRNLWPLAEPFVQDTGGYSTLNFLPSIVTMLLGVLTGELLRTAGSAQQALRTILYTSITLLAVGVLLDYSGACPSIKRLWTPSWVLISGGLIGLLVAGTYWLTDVRGHARAFEILRVVGLNSLILYVVLHLWDRWLTELAITHLGWNLLAPFSEMTATLLARLVAYVLLIGFCVWLHRRRIYLRL